MASKKKVLLIDRLLNEGWFENAKQAEAWIMERKVLVKNDLAYSGKILVSPTDPIRVKDYEKSKYASRGGYKLEGGLEGVPYRHGGKSSSGLRRFHGRVLRLPVAERRGVRICG